MKPFICLLSLAMLGLASASSEQHMIYEEYFIEGENPFVVTHELDTSSETGTESGSYVLSEKIGKLGAKFSLLDINQLSKSAIVWPLDWTFVSPTTPTAKIVIESEDRSWPVPRTRADIPYKAYISVDELGGNGKGDASISQVKVYVQMYYQTPKVFSKFVSDDAERVPLVNFDIESKISEHNPVKLSDPVIGGDSLYSQIPAYRDMPFRQIGKETIEAYAYTDKGKCGEALTSASIDIWPIASIKILGIADNDKIIKSMPDVTFEWKELYPQSETWVQIYKGKPGSSGNGVQVIEGPYRKCCDAVPQEFTYTLPSEKFDQYILEDGQYTMEVVTKTPFYQGKPERLMSVTFNVSRTVKVHGSVTGAE